MNHMDDNTGLFYLEDGVQKRSEATVGIDMEKNKVIYEVIRIIEGVPLFFEDHYLRMTRSFEALGGRLGIGMTEMGELIRSLVRANQNSFCNVKVMVFDTAGGQKSMLYISKSYYPGSEEINKGVSAGLLKIERNDPNVKVINLGYKEAVNKRMLEGRFFEVLLVNREDRITEGSKSNVFFAAGGKIFTAPGAAVLKGVTRSYVMEACRRAGVQLVESFVAVKDLESMEGAFLSGTSIKVLPISSIEGRIYKSPTHPAVVSVRDEFDRLVKNYIEGNVKIW